MMKCAAPQPPLVRQTRVPIYNARLLFCLADSMEETKVIVEAYHLGSSFEQNTNCAGRVTFDNNGRFGILFERRSLDYGVIGHECFHLTVCILRYANVTFDANDSHEAHAYLCGWLTAWVYRVLTRSGTTIQSR